MAYTLDDLIAAPNDPDQMQQHLLERGLLRPPPEIQAAIPPAQVAQLSSVTPPSTVAPMVPPALPPTGKRPARAEEVATMGGTPPTAAPVPLSPVKPYEPMGETPPITHSDVEGLDLLKRHEGLNLLKRPEEVGAAAEGNLPTTTSPLALPEATGPGSTPGATVAPMTAGGISGGVKPMAPPYVGSAAETRDELAPLTEKDKDTMASHPTFMGKVGHVLGKIGNIGLDVVAPGLAGITPGTELNRAAREAQLKRELARRTAAESTQAASDVTTQEGRQRLLKLQNEQSLVQDTNGYVTGWKGPDGVLHDIEAPETPQAIKNIAAETEARTIKPSIEKMDNGDVVAIMPGRRGAAPTSQVVYHGDPKLETELTEKTVGNEEHKILINKKTGETIKDLGKFSKPLSASAEFAHVTAGQKPVMAMDKNGEQHMMTRAEAESRPEFNPKKIMAASDKDVADLKQNSSALNDMGVKLKNLYASRKALDQGIYERGLIARALATDDPNSLIYAGAVALMSPMSKEYVQDVFSMREAALALPKHTTGGSRVSEPQAKALWSTVPGVAGDSKYAEKQLRKFDENLARLWKKVPHMEGQDRERMLGEQTGAGGGKVAALTPPSGKVLVLDDKGEPHFANEATVDRMLKDPQYKGWTRANR